MMMRKASGGEEKKKTKNKLEGERIKYDTGKETNRREEK